MTAKYETQIIHSIHEVPTGYVPVPSLRGNHNGYWPTISKAISEAHAAGLIRAAKLVRCLGDCKTGRVFVHEGDAKAFIAERYPHATHAPAAPAAEPPRPAVARESSDELLAAIKRLTAAVEDLTAAMQLRAEATLAEEAVA